MRHSQWRGVTRSLAADVDTPPAGARDIAQRVAACVTVRGRVRHLADADAVEHDPYDAAKHFLNVAALSGATPRLARRQEPVPGSIWRSTDFGILGNIDCAGKRELDDVGWRSGE